MNLPKITVKKRANRLLNSKYGVPADQLTKITAIRVIGNERKLGQYKLIDGSKTKRFNNFKELRFYNNLVLRNQHKFITIIRD